MATLLVRAGLEWGRIWRQGASNERSSQYLGVVPAARSSPYTEPGYSTQARRYWYYIGGEFLGMQRLRHGEGSTACSLQDSQSQGQPVFPAVLRRPDGALYASGHWRLQIGQQGNRRVNQVDCRLLVDKQEQTYSVASTTPLSYGHPFRRPYRSLVRRRERLVHRGGVPAVLIGDRYYPRVRRYQNAAANRCILTR